MTLKIPKQISGFNFVLIGGDGKKPIEKGWQKKVHKIDCPIFKEHIKKGKNYGVQSNNSSVIIDGKTYFLVVVDFDTKEFQDKVISLFPETFATTSGSKKRCLHLWFASDNNKAFKIKDEKLNTLADVIGAGNQVIAPGSKHNSGSTYSVVKNVPIAFMPYAELEAMLKPHDRSPKKAEKIKKQYTPKGISNDVNKKIFNSVSMEQLLSGLGIDTSKNPTDCPLHLSNGGKCLSWNNETAHCFHCQKERDGWNKYSLVRDAKKLSDKETFEWFAGKAGMLDELNKSRKDYIKDKRGQSIPVSPTNLKNLSKTNPEDFRSYVLMLLASKKRDEATEMLCQEIYNIHHLYTTRDDEKSDLWIYQEGIYVPNGRTYVKEFCRAVLGEAYTNHIANDVISKIETDTYIEAKEFFKESASNEIPVKNGILDIFTKTLREFTPEKRFFTKIPINFIPGTDCPLIKGFLKQIHRYENDIPIVQEFFGYCLLRDYRIEKAFMLMGFGRNGKSRLLELIKRYLGHENCVNIQLQEIEKDTFVLSEFHGKLANVSGDISKEALENTGSFKLLTGQDPLTANRKFKVRLTFLNYAKLIYAANELPKTYDLTDAFFNRWVLLEYPFVFLSQKELDKLKDEDKKAMIDDRPKYNLADKEVVSKISTEEELSGLLNWALEGLARLLQQRDFSYSNSIQDVKNLWIRKSDSFMAFCMDNVAEDSLGYTTKEELRKKYNDYCKAYRVIPVGDKSIKETLTRNYGVTDAQKMVNGELAYVWLGITWEVENKEKEPKEADGGLANNLEKKEGS